MTARSNIRGRIEPVFLLGISHRSGTNYLANLLERHPKVSAGPLPEDFLIARIEYLAEYLLRVRSEWSARWDVEYARKSLCACLANGLEEFLCDKVTAGTTHVLSRTPSVDGLMRLRDFFPEAYVIILVRDGRAVVESGMQSFAWHFDDASRKWASSAAAINDFLATDPAPERSILVKYEELFQDTSRQLGQIFEFLGLDIAEVPADSATRVEVIGSSELRSTGGELHWEPAKIDGFDPLGRYAGWTIHQHRRFDWLAGASLEMLGYSRTGQEQGLINSVKQSARSFLAATRPREIRRTLRRSLRRR